jgi:FkbM family methyltransferase
VKCFRLPNGTSVWNAPKAGAETRFIYKEVFEQRCYEQHGVTVANGDVVIDVGSNVGLFSLSLIERYQDLRLFCFEPVPGTRACLERNLADSPHRARHDIRVFDVALGAHDAQTTISFYPAFPGNSTLYAERKGHEVGTMIDLIRFQDVWKTNKVLALLTVPLYPIGRPLLRALTRKWFGSPESFPCAVRTLSGVLRAHEVPRVDLLKVDVEGAELDVLEGIEDAHWPLIRQISMEVAPANRPHLDALEAKLRGLGFRAITREGMLKTGSPLDEAGPCNFFAVR